MSPHCRTGVSYMRSTSTAGSLSHDRTQDSPDTPQFSNQHWLSSFRQGLDGIDELTHEDDEDMEEEVHISTRRAQNPQDSVSGLSFPVPLPPASSSPPASALDSDLSANGHMSGTSSATSLSSSPCFSDALRLPLDHELDRDIDVAFLAQLQERIALVVREREREQMRSERESISVERNSLGYCLDSALSAARTHESALTSLDQRRDDQEPGLHYSDRKRTRSMMSQVSQDHLQGRSSVPSSMKRARMSATSASSSMNTSMSTTSNRPGSNNKKGKENEGFASVTATTRRALSLRSQDTSGLQSSGALANADRDTKILEKPLPADWVPTAPCSPAHEKPRRCLPPPRWLPKVPKKEEFKVSLDAHTDTDSDNESEIEFKKEGPPLEHLPLPSPVPIIAPPIDWIPQFPLSTETQAKKRVERFREREVRLREVDKLDLFMDDGTLLSWGGFGIDQDVAEEMLEWILEILPFQTHTPVSTVSRSPPMLTSSKPTSASASSESSMDSFRGSSHLSSVSSSPASVPIMHIHDIKTPYQKGVENLVQQLRTSPETRFMGAYNLMRFFWSLSVTSESHSHIKRHIESGKLSMPASQQTSSSLAKSLKLDEELFLCSMWDAAVGCLALSVKMYRDFLPPLFPVYSQVFEDMAPHATDYERLEDAQRYVLFALKYDMGGSPQAVLDELWECGLLRDLLVYAGYGPICQDEKELLRWWGAIQRETWGVLFRAVMEPRVLHWPLSIVTGCAVLLAVEKVLVFERYAGEVHWWCEFEFRMQKNGKEERRRQREAKKECEGLEQDVKEVLGIGDVRSFSCSFSLPMLTKVDHYRFSTRSAALG
ncbi:hypothetical protein PQX77_018263 [Marasmius sp. AFHP31]|nr:hypothetical protein PQX77_018263 [Marasmius sp. AFHP31]